MITADQRHAALIESLIREGTLTDAPLIEAFHATPRHMFVPEVGARTIHGTELNALTHPEQWLSAVYTDDALVTQTDKPDPGSGTLVPTSSNSAPTIVARMLEAADLRRGERVLEVGTGTGWNAALLAARLGASNVTTVEVDPDVATAARFTLLRIGHDVCAHRYDGEHGYPPGAPYDRTIATCSVTRVPRAWIDQTSAGGLVVTPWTALDGAGVLARLTVAGDGSAEGQFRGTLGFMCLRSQRPPAVRPNDLDREPDETRLVDTDPITSLTDFDTAFPLGFMVPSWRMGMRHMGHGPGVWLSATDGSAWARVSPHGNAWAVEQGGSRSLWDEFENAQAQWRALGSPGPARYGLTVATDGTHRIWLDTPAGPTWSLPH